MGMNLLGMRYFISVAEYASFTKASEHLFVTQPTLSRQILDLEEELGVQLFVRGRRSLTLTPQGKLFLREATEIIKRCDDLPALLKEKNDAKGDVIGLLRIGYQSFLDTTLMNDTLQAVTGSHPRIDFLLLRGTPPELKHYLLIDKCDVVFVLQAYVEGIPGITCLQRQANKLRLAIPRDHPLAKGDAIRMKDLANENFIMLDRKISPMVVDYATSLCMQNGFSPNASYYVNNAEKAMLLVASGKGVAFLHSMNNVNSSQVKVMRIADVDDDLGIMLAYKTENANPIIQLFLAALQERREQTE